MNNLFKKHKRDAHLDGLGIDRHADKPVAKKKSAAKKKAAAKKAAAPAAKKKVAAKKK